MNSQEAEQMLFQQVYLPTFVKACADQGIAVNTEEDFAAALQAITILKTAEAEQTTNIAKSATADLMAVAGIQEPAMPKMAASVDEIKRVSSSPSVQEAVQLMLQ